MTPDLSVAVVSWNTRELLRACLESLRAAADADRLSLEVFVVDNGSGDGSPEMVRADFPAVRLIAHDHNRGFARATNDALRVASGRFLLLLNSDTRVPVGALRALADTLDDAGVVAVGPLLRGADQRLQTNWARFPTFASEWAGRLDRSQAPVPPDAFEDPSRCATLAPFRVDWIGGACLMARGDAVRRAGLLDERFFFFGEDVEWCRRLGRLGEIRVVPQACVLHLGGGSRQSVPVAARRWLWSATVRVFFALYGPVGGLPGALAATGRWLLSPLRRSRA